MFHSKDSPSLNVIRKNSFLLIFLLIELLIRPLLQPDPWLLSESHWYFYQPLRLLIEFTMVAVVFYVLTENDKDTLILPKNQRTLLIISSLASLTIFSLLELNQLQSSFSAGIGPWIIWFATGFFIGMGQELIYRGLLYNYLIGKYSLLVTWTLVTVIFVLMPLHSVRLLDYFQSGEYQIILILSLVYTGMSLFFLWLRKETQSVAIPAIVHGLGNAITWVSVFAFL